MRNKYINRSIDKAFKRLKRRGFWHANNLPATIPREIQSALKSIPETQISNNIRSDMTIPALLYYIENGFEHKQSLYYDDIVFKNNGFVRQVGVEIICPYENDDDGIEMLLNSISLFKLQRDIKIIIDSIRTEIITHPKEIDKDYYDKVDLSSDETIAGRAAKDIKDSVKYWRQYDYTKQFDLFSKEFVKSARSLHDISTSLRKRGYKNVEVDVFNKPRFRYYDDLYLLIKYNTAVIGGGGKTRNLAPLFREFLDCEYEHIISYGFSIDLDLCYNG